MRVAYLATWNISAPSGVTRKIVSQVRCWAADGHQVALFALSPARQAEGDLSGIDTVTMDGSSPWTRPLQMSRLIRRLKAWGPDVVYLRYQTHYAAVADLMREVPTVLEINTDDLREYRTYLPRYQYLYHRATRGRILDRARGAVFVTEELSRRHADLAAPRIVIGNGIDLGAVAVASAPRNQTPRLVFIGSPRQNWHGTDKIATLARAFPDWHFDVIGAEVEGSAPANIRQHGVLARQDYEALLARADCGIGTLALHRKGMFEACSLKSREYLAHGLPCITAHDDPDFPDGADFILQLRNVETAVAESLPAIASFVERWIGKRVPRSSIGHLDIRVKEARRIRFLDRCASGR